MQIQTATFYRHSYKVEPVTETCYKNNYKDKIASYFTVAFSLLSLRTAPSKLRLRKEKKVERKSKDMPPLSSSSSNSTADVCSTSQKASGSSRWE